MNFSTKGSKTGSYLTIEKKKGSVVPVAVWEVTAADEHNLDIYEGYPNFYYKKNMKIRLSETGKMIDAFVYIMHEERRFGIPTSAMSAPANSDTPFSDLISSTLMKPMKKV